MIAKYIDSSTSADCLVDPSLGWNSSAPILIRCGMNRMSEGEVLLLIPLSSPSDAWESSGFSLGKKKKKRHRYKWLAGRLESCAHSYVRVLGIGTSWTAMVPSASNRSIFKPSAELNPTIRPLQSCLWPLHACNHSGLWSLVHGSNEIFSTLVLVCRRWDIISWSAKSELQLSSLLFAHAWDAN